MSKIQVWGIGTFRCFRVYWTLEELGLDYDHRPIRSRTGETNTPEYRRINPKEKIPTLLDKAFVISESAAIIEYLIESYGALSNFYRPTDLKERMRALEWNYFSMTELDATALYVIRRHKGLPEIYGDAPKAVESAEDYFFKQINAVKHLVSARGEFLCGAEISTADIIMTTNLDAADNYGIKLPREWEEYKRRMNERNAYLRAIKVNYPDGKIL